MANIQKRPNGKYRARYRDSSGKEHARHFVRKIDAQQWLSLQTASVLEGRHVSPKDSRTYFKDYAVKYEGLLLGKPNSLKTAKLNINRYLVPEFGTYRIADIKRSDVQKMVTRLSQSLARNTVISIYSTLSKIMTSAIDDRLIVVSPCQRIKFAPIGPKRLTIPNPAHLPILRDAMRPSAAPLVTLLAGSGLRIGEALALRVEDVDVTNRTITVNKQRSSHTGLIEEPKTKSSNRVVPVGDVVIGAIEKHLANRPIASEWLWLNEALAPMQYGNWIDQWTRANKEAGTNYNTHDLRHFAASALISGGASVKQVQQVLGHANASVTLNTYSHLWPGDEDRTRTVLDAALMGCGLSAD